MSTHLSALLIATWLGMGIGFGQEIRLSEEKSTYLFSEYAALLDIPAQDSLTWQQVYHLPANQFTAYIKFREDRPVQWIRLKLDNTTPNTLVYYQFLYHNLDYAYSYLIDSTGTLIEKQASGALVKISERPFQEFAWNYSIIPNQIPPGRSTLLIRVENTRDYTLQHRRISKLSFIEGSLFYDHFGGSSYFSGMFLGYFLAIMFLSIVLFFSEKEKIYLQTSVLILCGSIYPFVIDGHFFKLFFPNYSGASLWVENVLPMAALTITNWIVGKYLNIRSIAPKALIPHHILLTILVLLFAPAFLNIYVYSLWTLLAAASVLYTLLLGLLAAKHRLVHAYYFCIGYAILVLLFTFGFFARYFEIMNYQMVIQFFNVQAVANIYFSFLLIAVLDRFRRSRKEAYELQLSNERAIHEAKVERLQLIEQQNVELEQKVEERTLEIELKNEELKKLDKMKSRFFSNISHEFRTPLTLIIGPARNQLKKVKNDPKSKRDLETILASADQLLELINQLLDLAKAENDKLELNLEEVSTTVFIQGQIQLFYTLAENKRIHLLFNEVEDFTIHLDLVKMKNVLANVVFNALKFSPEQSNIAIKAYRDQSCAYFEVIDQGPGIPVEDQENIFERFYQVNATDTTKGSGIGLALAKVYVTLHGGRIHVEKNIRIGSKFIIELPLHVSDRQVDSSWDKNQIAVPKPKGSISKNLHTDEIDSSKPNILIVEDEATLRFYVKSCFDDAFQVDEAKDGLEGLEMARSLLPDLIISDVMMPKMDGVKLTENLKTDMLTSHIPVLLLTAKASKESKVDGLGSGADDYLTKPFDSEELVARVKSLLHNRALLYEKYGQAISKTTQQEVLPKIENKFIELVTAAIEKNMANDQFDVEKLSECLNINRTTLYRKLKTISSQTPTAYIKTIRLKRAKQMLEDGQMNVSEIAYAVGFSSATFFASSFKEVYGVSPSAYVT